MVGIAPGAFGLGAGNNDLVIFVLFAIAVWFVTRPAPTTGGRRWSDGARGGVEAVSLVALPALASRPVSRRQVLWIIGGTAAVCTIVLLSALADYQRTMTMAEPFTIFGYGAKHSPSAANHAAATGLGAGRVDCR